MRPAVVALAVLLLFAALGSGCATSSGGGVMQFRPVPRSGASSRGLEPPTLAEQERAAVSERAATPSGWPIKHPELKVISPYGVRRGRSRFHRGIDIKAPRGAPVVATAPGTVSFAGIMRGYGKLVVVDHGAGVATAYGHLDRIDVAVGDVVRKQATIGRLGATGNASTPHVHYEVRVADKLVDPTPYISPSPEGGTQ